MSVVTDSSQPSIFLLGYKEDRKSSEYGLSKLQYFVKVFLVDHKKQRFPAIELDLGALSSNSRLVTPGKKFKVMWMNEKGIVGNEKDSQFIQENSEGWVCACNSADPKTITKVRDAASQSKAIALFSLAKTLTDTNIPVFDIDKSLMDKMLLAQFTQVMFDLGDLPDRQGESVDEFLPVADAGDFNAAIPDLTSYDNREKEPLESEIDYSIKKSTEYVRPSYAAVARSAPDDGTTLLSAISGVVAGAVNFFSRSKKGPFLNDNSDVFLCYNQAFGKIESMDVTEAVVNGQMFIERKAHSICLGHFTALAYLCNKSLDEGLIRELVHCLVHYQPSRDDSEFLKSTRKSKYDTWCLPHTVLYRFLVNNVHHWATCDEKTTLWKGIQWTCSETDRLVEASIDTKRSRFVYFCHPQGILC